MGARPAWWCDAVEPRGRPAYHRVVVSALRRNCLRSSNERYSDDRSRDSDVYDAAVGCLEFLSPNTLDQPSQHHVERSIRDVTAREKEAKRDYKVDLAGALEAFDDGRKKDAHPLIHPIRPPCLGP